MRGSRAAAPKGTKSCRIQGTFVRPFIRPSVPQVLSGLKSALSENLVIVNQQELSSRNLQALVEALDWGLKQQELSRNLKILHGGKIWQELSENSRNLEGLG